MWEMTEKVRERMTSEEELLLDWVLLKGCEQIIKRETYDVVMCVRNYKEKKKLRNIIF